MADDAISETDDQIREDRPLPELESLPPSQPPESVAEVSPPSIAPVVEIAVPSESVSMPPAPTHVSPEVLQSESGEPIPQIAGQPASSISTNSPPPVEQQSQPPASPTSIVNVLLVKARAIIQTRKRKKLERIMEDVAKHGSTTNDQVEKSLHISDTSATRYLGILVREGRLKQIGTTGKAVRYEAV